jgi:C4-dicarboxylate-specific signal transduction histidine kinase
MRNGIDRRGADALDWAALRARRISEMIALGFSDEEAAAEGRRAEARVRARTDYAAALGARMRAAFAAVDAAWDRRFDERPELLEETDEADEALRAMGDPPEEAELEALLAEVHAIADRDAWPRHLYFHGV